MSHLRYVKHINELLLKDTAYAFALAECIKEDYATSIHVSKTANNSMIGLLVEVPKESFSSLSSLLIFLNGLYIFILHTSFQNSISNFKF